MDDERERIWELIEDYARELLDLEYVKERDPDMVPEVTRRLDQARRELRQALGFAVD